MPVVFVIVASSFLLLALYLRHVQNGMKQTPQEILDISPNRWTDEEVLTTYDRIGKQPVDFSSHLPPRLNRRYIVVGGSGLVGGFIVLHLLARGQPPESIRIVDFVQTKRKDMLKGPATKVGFVKADISSIDSTKAAFSHPWPDSVGNLPLTVFHTAAVIRASERKKHLLNRCWAINTTGTANVIAASKAAGADILIFTSSASIAIRPVNHWIPPWRKTCDGYVQIYKDPEDDETIREHDEYFTNYAMTKAAAEDLVLREHGKAGLKTGSIRPGCVVYGTEYDISFGPFMKKGRVETWIPHMIQNWVHAENISLAHLLYESALLQPSYKGGGRAFVISDPNPPIAFGDLYKVLNLLTGCQTVFIPPIIILIMAWIMEYYCLFVYFVGSRFGMREPTGDLYMLQPSVLSSSTTHQHSSDMPARQSVKNGGLGYKGGCTTLEGMCHQVRVWKNDTEEERRNNGGKGVANVVEEFGTTAKGTGA